MLVSMDLWLDQKAGQLIEYLDRNPIPAADAVEIVFPKLQTHSKLRIVRSLTEAWIKRKQRQIAEQQRKDTL